MQLQTFVALTWGTSSQWQQQENPQGQKTEGYNPGLHYDWTTGRVHADLCVFFSHFFHSGLVGQSLLDWLVWRHWKWEALHSRWKWNMSTKCEPRGATTSDGGVPRCPIIVPSASIMYERVPKLTQISCLALVFHSHFPVLLVLLKTLKGDETIFFSAQARELKSSCLSYHCTSSYFYGLTLCLFGFVFFSTATDSAGSQTKWVATPPSTTSCTQSPQCHLSLKCVGEFNVYRQQL